MLKYLQDGTLPPDKAKAREIVPCVKEPKRQIDELRACLVVPEELKFDILTSVHGDLHSGHNGTQRTYSILRLKYFWKGMYKDCRNFVLSCQKCNTKKNPTNPTKAPLQPLPPARINKRWAMDIVHMPVTPRGTSISSHSQNITLGMLRHFLCKTHKLLP